MSRKLFCETCDGPAKPACRASGHAVKRRYSTNKGLRKRCECARRTWETCAHPYYFNYKGERGCLGVSEPNDAKRRFSSIKAEIDNGTYQKTKPQPPLSSASPSRTFAHVANAYKTDAEGLTKLSASEKEKHDYEIAFLTTVMINGTPFTELPFSVIGRPEIKYVVGVKAEPVVNVITTKDGKKREQRTGGRIAANRLYDHLRALWNWAIEEGYASVSPFIRIRKGKNKLKHDEAKRDRRLQDGEELALVNASSSHLRDCVNLALATGMRKNEILSLQWKQVRFLQNEIYLPASKTKSKRDRSIPLPIKPIVREILKSRQTGTTKGPNPQAFTFGPDHYVCGNEAGERVTSIKTAWESAVLRAHGLKVERTRGRLSAANRAKLAEIDLNFHDLRHECASRLYFDEGWTIYDVSILLGHADVKTTERYIGADQKKRLHELVAKRALTLVHSQS